MVDATSEAGQRKRRAEQYWGNSLGPQVCQKSRTVFRMAVAENYTVYRGTPEYSKIRLTGLYTRAASRSRIIHETLLVGLGWEFHSGIAFLKWAIGQGLVEAGEILSPPL